MTTVVLLCSHGASCTNATGQEKVTVVADLCRRPDRIKAALGEADRLVLGMCGREYSLGAVQAEVRRAGLDPLGVEIFDVSGSTSEREAFDAVLNAKIARAGAFAGSSPANAKISFPQKVNRRELLRGAHHEYRAAPSVDTALCAAASGCRACVDVCPQEALSVSGQRVHHDRSICEPCGLCVTTCPTGATINPATTPSQLEAEIAALLDSSVGPTGARGIAFSCSQGKTAETPPGWHTVSLPCVGMVTPGYLLAPLLMGAGAVAARSCGDTGCPLGHDKRTLSAIDFCREFLQSLGESPDRVWSSPSSRPPEPLPEAALEDPFGPGGAVEVMLSLAAGGHSARSAIIDHPGAPTGLIDISTDTCTGCTMCAQVCPTGALAAADSRDRVTISFDPAKCSGCAQCIPLCPELDRGAISLQTRVDLTALAQGRTTLIEAGTVRCELCGGPIAPAPMLARITSMFGPEQEAVRTLITTRCRDCRALGS